jgi:methyltransferase (TIGR00027 family)
MARAEVGDELVRRFVTIQGGRQIVSLGSGLDSRAYRIDCVNNGAVRPPLKYFEVDVAPSQEMKIRLLRANKVKNDHVTYVPVDFTTQTYSECLKKNDWKEDEPSLFLWEGVSYYLPEEAVHNTFRTFSKCAKGSLLLLDLMVCF